MSPVSFPGGRRYAPDARDANFPMRLRLDPLRAQFFPRGLPPGTRHYKPTAVLDQGQTGTCVGHGWKAKFAGAPVMRNTKENPFDLYRLFIREDEFTDNDHEFNLPDSQLQAGTSVRAGAQVGQRLGYLENYLWAKDAEDVRSWMLANFGGVVFGIFWTDLMMRPDSEGFIRYKGTIEGGHCVVSTGWSDHVKHNGKTVQAVRIQNSWGKGWGQKGRCWIEIEDLDRLVQDQGEACAPTELKVK